MPDLDPATAPAYTPDHRRHLEALADPESCARLGPESRGAIVAVLAEVERLQDQTERISTTAVEVLIGRYCTSHGTLSFDQFVEVGGDQCPLCLKAEVDRLRTVEIPLLREMLTEASRDFRQAEADRDHLAAQAREWHQEAVHLRGIIENAIRLASGNPDGEIDWETAGEVLNSWILGAEDRADWLAAEAKRLGAERDTLLTACQRLLRLLISLMKSQGRSDWFIERHIEVICARAAIAQIEGAAPAPAEEASDA